MADEFTVANIRLAVAGIAAYVKTQPEPHRVLVGRDPRFLGESFVAEAARVLAAAGVTPIVIPEAAPTPAIAYAVRTLKTSGAINFTASHNPPEYNGIKFSTPDGAPALPEVTGQIEAAIAALASGGAAIPSKSPRRADLKPPTSSRPSSSASPSWWISRPSPNPASRWSTIPSGARGAATLSDLLREAGVAVETVHDYRDVLFGGHAPEPDDHLLGDAKAKMKEIGAALASPPTAMPTASASSMATAPSSSPTTSSRCSSTTWSRRAAGATAWPRAWPPPTWSTRWPIITRFRSTKRRWASSTSAS